VARLNFTETGNSDIRSAEIGRGRILVADDLMRLLSYAGIERETMVEQGLQFVRRLLPDGKCYYVVNGTNEPLDDWVPLQVDAKSVAIYEPMHGEVGLAAMKTSDSGANEVYLQLTPGESCILRVFENVIEGPSYCYVKTSGEPQKIEGTWSVTFIDSGPELPPNLEITELDSWTNFGPEVLKIFSGTAKYTISFHRPVGIVDGWMLDLGRVCESASVRLNGTDLGTLIGPDYRISIPNDIMQEDNILEIEVSNLMANRIADLDRRGVNWKKFYNINFPPRRRENRGPDGLFNASRWAPKDSGLIGPVQLVPIEPIDF
jgi:hypothetical protein